MTGEGWYEKNNLILKRKEERIKPLLRYRQNNYLQLPHTIGPIASLPVMGAVPGLEAYGAEAGRVAKEGMEAVDLLFLCHDEYYKSNKQSRA